MMAPCISRMRGFQMSGSSADSELSPSGMTRFPHASVVFAGSDTITQRELAGTLMNIQLTS